MHPSDVYANNSGWREPAPIGPPPGIAAIDAIVTAHLGPAGGRKATTDELIAEGERQLADLRAQQARERGEAEKEAAKEE
jgi:hypothetical protein